jgi:hypothetical protein
LSDSYLLNVVVAKSTTILKLLSGEDQTLLVGGDALLVLDLGLDIVDGVGGLDLKGDGLAREGLDETANKNTPSVYLHVFVSSFVAIHGDFSLRRGEARFRVKRNLHLHYNRRKKIVRNNKIECIQRVSYAPGARLYVLVAIFVDVVDILSSIE